MRAGRETMKKILLTLAILSLSACADQVTFTQAIQLDPVGFWYGLWHGITAPFSFVGSLFSDNIAIYAIYNSGGWYDLGFLMGSGVLLGSSGKAATSN